MVWTLVPRDGPRFENLVAAHLLKWVHHAQDVRGRDVELRYFRDTDGREVDFAVLEGRRLRTLVECKWDDAEVDRGLRYLKARFREAEAWPRLPGPCLPQDAGVTPGDAAARE